MENPGLAVALVRWREGEEVGRREGEERELTNGILMGGFNIPLETLPEEEQEELKAAVEDWNKEHTVQCEYPLKCPVFSVLCLVYSEVIGMPLTVHCEYCTNAVQFASLYRELVVTVYWAVLFFLSFLPFIFFFTVLPVLSVYGIVGNLQRDKIFVVYCVVCSA